MNGQYSLVLNYSRISFHENKIKNAISGKGGPYDQSMKVQKSQTLFTSIITSIIIKRLSDIPIYYAIGAFAGLLLVKKGLNRYCE